MLCKPHTDHAANRYPHKVEARRTGSIGDCQRITRQKLYRVIHTAGRSFKRRCTMTTGVKANHPKTLAQSGRDRVPGPDVGPQ